MRGSPFSNILIAGHAPLPPEGGMVAFRCVTPSYFRTLGIPLIADAGFQEAERSGAEFPLILSRALAKRTFGSENPIGQRISLDGNQTWLTVTGVVGDVKNSGLRAAASPRDSRFVVPDSFHTRLLFGVSTHDPFSFAVPIAALVFVGLIAAWRPSRRAAMIDPATALRVS